MKKLFFIAFLLLFTFGLKAQEFNCNVQINTQQIQGFDRSVISDMKTSITDFMNNRKWTNYNFKPGERIECTLLLTLTQVVASDEYKGTFNIVLQRPVYKTSYRSPLLNMIDKKVQFRYTPSQSMNFVENTYSDNLTSLLAFYTYMMLGIDFDTFANQGGTLYYQQAMSVVQAAQGAGFAGWQSQESEKNRYHFVEQFQNKAYEGLRNFLYQYHRLGLDVMYDDVVGGRKEILASLKQLNVVFNKRPGLYDLQLILDAKRSEIINVFSKAGIAERTNMINIMGQIDSPNGNRYRKVLKMK